MLPGFRYVATIALQRWSCSANLNMCKGATTFAQCKERCQIASGAPRDGHAINTKGSPNGNTERETSRYVDITEDPGFGVPFSCGRWPNDSKLAKHATGRNC